MVFRVLPAAAIVAAAFATAALAQGRPPAEMPPAGFAGQQYVDSRGCLFIRAGHGGQVNWVSRLDRARKPICGQTPSLTAMSQAKAQLAQGDQAPAAPLQAAPAKPLAPKAAPKPAQRLAAQSYVPPAVSYGAPQPLQRPAPGAVGPVAGCPSDAPHGRLFDLTSGRRVLVCAAGPHRLNTITEAEILRYAGGAAAPVSRPPAAARGDLMVPPPGYRPAWRDDRLNPHRGERSPEGRQQMQQIWTDETPPELRDPAFGRPSTMPPGYAGPAARHSSRGEPSGPWVGARFVQVGSFAKPGNAERLAAQLQRQGMPVVLNRLRHKGKPLSVVTAGPFADEGQAGRAMMALRAQGFSDAFLRR